MSFFKIYIYKFAAILVAAALLCVSTVSESGAETKGTINASEDNKFIALTFDDGPHPKYTNKILDILEEKNIRATFFVVGFRADLNRQDIKRMSQLGCEIGNHTWSHVDLSKLPKAKALEELSRTDNIICEITGTYPRVFRPPFGFCVKDELLKEIHSKQITWTLDSLDWKSSNYKKTSSNIINNVKNGDIILMHDFYDSTVSALETIIDQLTEKGFIFVTVSSLIRLHECNAVELNHFQKKALSQFF